MTLLLGLGFLIVAASGVLFRYRGRHAAGVAVVGAAIVGLAVSVIAGGREGVGEFVLGALTGLPVLIGGAVLRSRAEKAARSQAGRAQR